MQYSVCSRTLHNVALVCYNDPLHGDSSIATRAQGILRRAQRLQPACTVKYVTDVSQPGLLLLSSLRIS